MAGSESVEQTKQQETPKEDPKKPIEIKEEDLVCTIPSHSLVLLYGFFSLILVGRR